MAAIQSLNMLLLRIEGSEKGDRWNVCRDQRILRADGIGSPWLAARFLNEAISAIYAA